MDTKYSRTTLTLPEELVFEAKKRALAERKSLKEIVAEGLSLYLFSDLKTELSATIKSDINSLFGAWGRGVSGVDFVKKTRYGKKEKERELYIAKLWKKS